MKRNREHTQRLIELPFGVLGQEKHNYAIERSFEVPRLQQFLFRIRRQMQLPSFDEDRENNVATLHREVRQ